MVEWEVVRAKVLELRRHILLNQPPIFPIDVTFLHAMLQLYLGEAIWCMWCKTECTSDDHLTLILTSWQTVAQHLGLTKNDIVDIGQERIDEKERRLEALQKRKGKFGNIQEASWKCYHFLWQTLLWKYVSSWKVQSCSCIQMLVWFSIEWKSENAWVSLQSIPWSCYVASL